MDEYGSIPQSFPSTHPKIWSNMSEKKTQETWQLNQKLASGSSMSWKILNMLYEFCGFHTDLGAESLFSSLLRGSTT